MSQDFAPQGLIEKRRKTALPASVKEATARSDCEFVEFNNALNYWCTNSCGGRNAFAAAQAKSQLFQHSGRSHEDRFSYGNWERTTRRTVPGIKVEGTPYAKCDAKLKRESGLQK